MTDFLKKVWNGLITFLKENGLLPMTEEEYISKIPQDSKTFAQIRDLVQDMKPGETREFRFEPRDRSFHTDPTLLASVLCMDLGKGLYAEYETNPRKGKYLFRVCVLE